MGSIIHANVRPSDPLTKLNGVNWPPYIVVSGGPAHAFVQCRVLTYQICEHPALSGIACLKNVACHGYFKAPFAGALICTCKTDKGAEAGSSSGPQGKKKRANPRAAAAQMASSFGIDKSALPCRHFAMGTCNPKNKCGFMHPADPAAAGKLIPCALEKTATGCVGGDKCVYAHSPSPGMAKQPKPGEHEAPSMDVGL